ncbi:transcription-repair coupling factor [candidate division LCP-89 bacterium B3_LCP]|uniref:Transcription-repair-coupling factor n=1 Tax=candidate division LCP-89 bacterium B3_LCP TaxID=2012998 RepID=A0A532V3B4_UNCL8|nr:MAG: transcription-repair coupling factor [candidate division LCP-89 bacterium B3_LCP]
MDLNVQQKPTAFMPVVDNFRESLYNYPPFASITPHILRNESTILKGVPGCLKAFIVSHIIKLKRRILWISPRNANREAALSDLIQLLSEDKVGFLPAPQAVDDITPFEARIFRTRALQNWTSSQPFALVTEPSSVWLKLLPSKQELDRIKIQLSQGSSPGRDSLIDRLLQAGYSRVDMAENRGEYAVRGHILDIFPYTHDTPLRIEFWGNRLESLRTFDPATQRTISHLEDTILFLSQANGVDAENLISYSTPDDVLLIEDPEDCRLLATQSSNEELWDKFCENQTTIYTNSPRQDLPKIDIQALPQADFGGKMGNLVDSFDQKSRRGSEILIACDSEGQLERLRDLISDKNVAQSPKYFVAHLSGGFHLPDGFPSLLTDHQIFKRPRRRRSYFRFRNFSPIQHADTLKQGDYVVHENFGIGRYLGLRTINVGGHVRECLQIEYRGRTTLYVRLELLKKLQKYSGREGFVPPLTRIGRGEWEKIRKKAQKAVDNLADDLIKLYALRASRTGYAHLQDGSLQLELEAAFEYEETPDQLKAISDVKSDMEKPNPMDRLVCGDVGYGKTEVALRAAFKAIVSGKQVGILVPTTLLAQQHFHGFTDRLRESAVEVEMLSRFRTKMQQQRILKKLSAGQVDILIGTHRMLSRDVKFNNLGLLIVDEEHRFGVRHKERLKKLRSEVDVLTLTATPIPRTLHMAMIGARDMSLINTAPQDRLPIETEIAPFSQELITEAILREIDRKGQIYFVHNRVQSIEVIKEMLERWLPEVRFVVAHGQMPEKQLEETMSAFLDNKYDCLVSTMIIESGLDLPNVNTMIINRADRFGLAQLYQLRGRIGRSNRQAYAYLLTSPKLPVSDPAYKRLDAIRYCSYLGAGFQLAMKDLEIRGAGEIFGAKQSGLIHSVGFDLYQKMLQDALTDLKEDSHIGISTETTQLPDFEPKIEFPLDAYLPTSYVEAPGQRVNLYRKLSSARNYSELDSIVREITDRYGTPPSLAKNLFDLVELKLGCLLNRFPKLEINRNKLLAEMEKQDGDDWHRRLNVIVEKLHGTDVEFSGNEPPEILLKWESEETWNKKVNQAKNLLRKLHDADLQK